MSKPDPIKESIEVARANVRSAAVRLVQLEEECKRVRDDIAKWKNVADTLSAVVEKSSDEPPEEVIQFTPFGATLPIDKKLGFTDAIRQILCGSGIVMTAPQIRDRLLQIGFDFSKYAQELVPVHNTLTRLAEQGEVEPIKNESGNTVGYVWIDPVVKALNEERASRYASTLGAFSALAGAETMVPLASLLGPIPPRTQRRQRALEIMVEAQREQERKQQAEEAKKKKEPKQTKYRPAFAEDDNK